MNSRPNNFVRMLSFAFLASVSIFLLAGALTWYLLQQLENAVETSIDGILPEAMVAMNTSESSADLLVVASQLLEAPNQVKTNQIIQHLDHLKNNIIDGINNLEVYRDQHHHNQHSDNIRLIVNQLVGNLIQLKQLADKDIQYKQRLSQSLHEVQQVNNNLHDIINPVVWGVSSLSRLSTQRTIRQNQAAIKNLRDSQLPLLNLLSDIHKLFYKLKSSHMPSYQSYIVELEKKLELLKHAQKPFLKPVINQVEQALNLFKHDKESISPEFCANYDRQLKQAISQQKNQIILELSNSKQLTDLSISTLIEETHQDMTYALDIKAEGNLIFALLSSLADVNTEQKVTFLQNRFNQSFSTFHQAIEAFYGSRLSKRNPILSQSLKDIDQHLSQMGNGPTSLFQIRFQQIQNYNEINQLLGSNGEIVKQLKEHIQSLLHHVQEDSDILSQRLNTIRTFHNKLLLGTFLILLIISLLIAFFTIRKFGKHEQKLSQAAAVFNNTAEGIVITDSKSTIIAVNHAFSEISGYRPEEVIGNNIKILKSGKHRQAFYEEMWQQIAATGQWQGEICNRRKNGEIYPEWLTINAIYDHNHFISQYVAIFSDISLLKKSLAEMDHIANHDSLTGLPNRLLFNDRLKHAVLRAHRDRQKIAIFFLDLDHFKPINDNFGHKTGDELLCQVSKRLSTPLREADTIARLGGDEFTIIMENLSDKADAITTAKKILDVFNTPFHIDEQHFNISTSIGISLFPEHGQEGETLVENADMAMYLAKHTGKNNYQFYSPDLEIYKSPQG